ncbi:unnamed protein product [Closterium sp. NIES-64]|nr:unnamed protein product [Closterium sp. NIES-64]
MLTPQELLSLQGPVAPVVQGAARRSNCLTLPLPLTAPLTRAPSPFAQRMEHMLSPQELLSLGGSADAAAATASAAAAVAAAAAAAGRKGKAKGSGSGAGRSGGLGGAGGGKPLKFSYEWPAMGVPGSKWVADHALPWTAAAVDKDEDKEKDKDKGKEKGTVKGKDKAKSKEKDKEQEEEVVDAWEGFKGRLKEHWGRVVEEDYAPLLRVKQGGGDSSNSDNKAAKSSRSNVNGDSEGAGKRKRGKKGLAATAGDGSVDGSADGPSPEEAALGMLGSSNDGFASDHQRQFFSLCTSYSDVLHSRRPCAQSKFGSPLDAQALTDAYLLHALNHVFHTQDRITKNNGKLNRATAASSASLLPSNTILTSFPLSPSSARLLSPAEPWKGKEEREKEAEAKEEGGQAEEGGKGGEMEEEGTASVLFKKGGKGGKRERKGPGGGVVDGKELVEVESIPRDQGFTRPKVLVLLPYRNAALNVVQRLLRVTPPQSKVAVEHLDRFLAEFGEDESVEEESEEEDEEERRKARERKRRKQQQQVGRGLSWEAEEVEDGGEEEGGGSRGEGGDEGEAAAAVLRKGLKPVDHRAMFAGNNDDHFRLGIKFTKYVGAGAGNNDDHFRLGIKFIKKAVNLYMDVYQSDIIVASPIVPHRIFYSIHPPHPPPIPLPITHLSPAHPPAHPPPIHHPSSTHHPRKAVKLYTDFYQKSVKLYTDFYQSDIIVASPIGLVTKLGEAMEDSEKDMDFLSSIEIVIVDQADVILMQNWAHVEAVFAQLNKLPVKQHGTDFMRVREWYLNGWAGHYRQSIVLSAFSHPSINALFHRSCCNFSGKVTLQSERAAVLALVLRRVQQVFDRVDCIDCTAITHLYSHLPSTGDATIRARSSAGAGVKLRSEYAGVLALVVPQVQQVFDRVDCSAITAAAEARFQFFEGVLVYTQSYFEFGGVLVYTQSYFEFVRLRNFFKQENLSFCLLSEYTDERNVHRARAWFFQNRRRIMLYSEAIALLPSLPGASEVGGENEERGGGGKGEVFMCCGLWGGLCAVTPPLYPHPLSISCLSRKPSPQILNLLEGLDNKTHTGPLTPLSSPCLPYPQPPLSSP